MADPQTILLSSEEATHRQWILLPLVMVWLIAIGAGFWWFQFKDIRPFDPDGVKRAVFFESAAFGKRLQPYLPAESGHATVLHFWDPSCPCNRFNKVHVNKVITDYARQGVRFVIMVRAEGEVDPRILLAKARQHFTHPAVVDYRLTPAAVAPPSSPAAVVVDQAGELAYFGPYSVGAVCSAGTGAYVETVLNALAQGVNKSQVNTLAVGCFCQWRPVET